MTVLMLEARKLFQAHSCLVSCRPDHLLGRAGHGRHAGNHWRHGDVRKHETSAEPIAEIACDP